VSAGLRRRQQQQQQPNGVQPVRELSSQPASHALRSLPSLNHLLSPAQYH
jgi:hypothetical protein